jgi:hypothetical protein
VSHQPSSICREYRDKFIGIVRVTFRRATEVTGDSVMASTTDGRNAGAFQFLNRNIVRYEGDYELIRFLKKRFVKVSRSKEEWVEFEI